MNSSLLIKNISNREKDVVNSIKNRDLESFGLFYDQYSPALYAWLLSKTNDSKISEEILLGSFLKIWQTIHLYDPSRCKFFIWLLQVCAREMKKYSEKKFQESGKFAYNETENLGRQT